MGANRKKSLTTLSAGEFPESLNKHFYNTQAVNNVWLWPARAAPERENNFLNTCSKGWFFPPNIYHSFWALICSLLLPPSLDLVVPLWSCKGPFEGRKVAIDLEKVGNRETIIDLNEKPGASAGIRNLLVHNKMNWFSDPHMI